jgi:hypothetical protein
MAMWAGGRVGNGDSRLGLSLGSELRVWAVFTLPSLLILDQTRLDLNVRNKIGLNVTFHITLLSTLCHNPVALKVSSEAGHACGHL